MDEQTFWELVGSVGRQPTADAYDRLIDRLSDHGAGDIRDFADHLARALYALDTPAHYRASPDRFLAARCAAVAAGVTAYQEVLTCPETLPRHADQHGELLLPVAERAYRTSTRGPWEHRTPVSHETRSNVDAWRTSWLHPLLGSTSRAPQAYLIALQHVAITLDGDLTWYRWWRGSGLTECELGIVTEGRLDHLRPSADIRREDNRIRANFTCALPAQCATETGPRPVELLGLAATELTGMFEVIREAIGLPALPALPPLPAPAPDAHDVEVTTRAIPAAPREPEQQGYLTLTQIQEFFR